MHEQADQKLSQFIDNELNGEDTLQLLQRLKNQPEVDEKMRRFQFASRVIRNETPLLADTDFVQQVNQAIQQEVTYLLPKQRKSMRTLISGLAIAASVATVAVFINIQPDITPTGQNALLIADNQQKDVDNLPIQNQLQPVGSRFQDYLYAHRGSLYIAEPAVQPYAKLAGYGR